MRVVVTGATGFVGGAAARAFVRSGHTVVGIGRDIAAGSTLRADGVDFVRMDIRQPEWDRVLTGTDVVVHAAAVHSLWDTWAAYRHTNVEATGLLARACRKADCRMIYVSHSSVYNVSDRQWNIPESQPVGPRFDSRYALSKYLAEEAILGLLPEATVLRLRRVYGPGDQTFFPHLARVIADGTLPRLVRGEVRNQLLHIGNAVEAIELAAARPGVGLVNIADDELVGMWDVVDRIADAIGAQRPRRRVPAKVAEVAALASEFGRRVSGSAAAPQFTASAVRMLTRGMSLDLSRARAELGYWAVIEPEVGVAAAIEALRPRPER